MMHVATSIKPARALSVQQPSSNAGCVTSSECVSESVSQSVSAAGKRSYYRYFNDTAAAAVLAVAPLLSSGRGS